LKQSVSLPTMTPVTIVESVRRAPAVRVQPFALPLLFVVFGMIMGSWAGRIPALREGVQISHSALSMVLLCGGLGAVLSFPVSSYLMKTFGGRKTLFYSGSALLVVLICIGLAPTVPLLMLAVLLLGITASSFDVGVNAVATGLEKRSGKSSLSRLHACGGAGGLVGATLGSLMAGAQITPARHFMMLALPLAFALWLGYTLLEDDGAARTVEKKSFCLPRGPLALLGALGFFGAIAEGSIADWSGVYLKDHFAVSDGFAPLALSAFSVMMLIARLAGDQLKERFGARRLVSGGATLAACGIAFAVFAPDQYFAIAGFAVAGLGLSIVFPFVFSAAGREGPMALTGVATLTYTGTLMGPPIVGSLAHGLGIQAAMGFVALFALTIAVIANKTSMLK
jgi:MFS family permease